MFVSIRKNSCRPLFGGYSLAIDNTVFAMMAEGEIYLRVCEQSAEYRVAHKNPLLKMQKNGRLVALKYYHMMRNFGGIAKCFFIYRRCHYRARVMKNIGSDIPED
ncbi:competence-specific genes regulator [Klebsiella michiganensis]|uniref:Competence-specific genes regulator n=1 Tax=Klebsiella michiganensis TaxID=1134687 RepID=A0A7H4LVY8_9ENTR|nr:competence-specific genes regulator [Klebsiella michiganensis]